MVTRLLIPMALFVLFSSTALADDFWDTPWFTDTDTEHASHGGHGDADGSSIIFPSHSLSLATHGAYFGSGNEFLMGGGQVVGLGGVRHSDHSNNHPTYGVYPEVQHLFGGEAGYMGPMWGVPSDFSPNHGELAGDQATDEHHPPENEHRGNTGIINDDVWWDD